MRVRVLVILLAVGASACGNWDRSKAQLMGGATKTCVDGVTYLQFASGATVQVDTSGKPVACR